MQVLVAEDDPTTQMLCHEMITELGHQCFVSPDGAHALAALATQANSFDVLLTDYMMPEMDGIELILRLMASGFSNKEIANSLGVAEGTIKNHVSSILSKLGVRDRTRAVLKAFELQLV